MIKRIIFDLDDTLIKVPKSLKEEYGKLLKKYNIDIDPIKLYKVIGMYEVDSENIYYDIDKILELINNKLNINLNKSFVDDFFKMYNKLITPVPKSTKSTLKYLSSKYELVVLSNWFTNSQIERLKTAGIYIYFKEVYGADIVPKKPIVDSYKSAIGNNKIEECLMVGDNFDMDIKVPYEIGMNVCYLTSKKTKYPSIKSIDELKELL